ncbi:Uncharacterized protein SCG7086_AF_00100 [Chlamydiales bacterium SCGC AG-110-P3]|nr:Uncharacterized protein SCG7086_AF_00100 [Chlamydiales bacterium SCGC AG-110-P3]
MNRIRTIIRLLGSIRFTVFLITTVTLMVIAGTITEAYTDSHRYAAALTYSNPFFETLLLGFFLNILISALLRWPFHRYHIPFLLTHLGLLMIISGAAIKGRYGVQGTTALLEGAGTDRIFIQDTYEILVESRVDEQHYPLQLKSQYSGSALSRDLDLADFPNIRLLAYAPHGIERVETWIKHTTPLGHQAVVAGLAPLPVAQLTAGAPPVGARARVFPGNRPPWTFYAAEVDNVEQTVRHLLREAISPSSDILDITVSTSPVDGVDTATLQLNGRVISLTDIRGLQLSSLPRYSSETMLSAHPFIAFLQDVAGETHLIALDETGHLYTEQFSSILPRSVAVYDDGYSGYGVHTTLPFSPLPHDADSLRHALLLAIAQDLRQAEAAQIPLAEPLERLAAACRRSHADFPNTCARLLDHWYCQGGWLYYPDGTLPPDLSRVLNQIEWSTPDRVTAWSSVIFSDIERGLGEGVDLFDVLRQKNWPLVDTLSALRSHDGPCQADELPHLFEAITSQLQSVAEHLPEAPQLHETTETTLQRLTVGLRTHGIHLSAMTHEFNIDTQRKILERYVAANAFALRVKAAIGAGDTWSEQRLASSLDANALAEPISILESQLEIVVANWMEWIPPVLSDENDASIFDLALGHPGFNLETPITLHHTPSHPSRKLEDNLPLVTIEVQKGGRREQITLAYDKYGTGLKWPVLDGNYMVRFQPQFKQIPYRLRLRDARQINYANTNQAFSYEADMLFQAPTGEEIPDTISMNCVHETWDGYRFYLANITPPNEAEVQQAQIVVNLDPVKYQVTYPGGIILTLGIVLLFTRRSSRR